MLGIRQFGLRKPNNPSSSTQAHQLNSKACTPRRQQCRKKWTTCSVAGGGRPQKLVRRYMWDKEKQKIVSFDEEERLDEGQGNNPSAEDKQAKVKEAKETLVRLVEGTHRGANLSRDQRGAIEEAQVAVESTKATEELDYRMLGGYWMLRYTTAQDVKPILAADENSPLRIGNIYQRFTSPDEGRGTVDNIIQAGVPFLLQDANGVTVTVQASYEVRSGHLIALTFDSANVGQLRIDPFLEALITPSLLPRTFIQLLILQALRQFELKFPFRSAAQVATGVASGNSRQVAGGQYHLTYLDEDMLIGRAIALGGTFVLTRAPEPNAE